MIFSATVRLSGSVCSAMNTAPMPPSPICAMTSYGPNFVPGVTALIGEQSNYKSWSGYKGYVRRSDGNRSSSNVMQRFYWLSRPVGINTSFTLLRRAGWQLNGMVSSSRRLSLQLASRALDRLRLRVVEMVAAEEPQLEAVMVNVAVVEVAGSAVVPPRTCRFRGDPMGIRDWALSLGKRDSGMGDSPSPERISPTSRGPAPWLRCGSAKSWNRIRDANLPARSVSFRRHTASISWNCRNRRWFTSSMWAGPTPSEPSTWTGGSIRKIWSQATTDIRSEGGKAIPSSATPLVTTRSFGSIVATPQTPASCTPSNSARSNA